MNLVVFIQAALTWWCSAAVISLAVKVPRALPTCQVDSLGRVLQRRQNTECSAGLQIQPVLTPLQPHCCSANSKKKRERRYLGKNRCRAWCSPPSKSVHHHFSLIQRSSWELYEGWRGCLGNLNDAVWGLFMFEFCRVMRRHNDGRHLQHICCRRGSGNPASTFYSST